MIGADGAEVAEKLKSNSSGIGSSGQDWKSSPQQPKPRYLGAAHGKGSDTDTQVDLFPWLLCLGAGLFAKFGAQFQVAHEAVQVIRVNT